MSSRKTTWSVVGVLIIVGLLIVGQSLSQPQRGQRGQRGGAQGMQRSQRQGGQFDPERMRQMMEQRMKETLGATDQEWKVLGPRVMKVQELSRQIGGGGRGMMMFGRGMRGGPGGNRPGGRGMDTNRQLTEVEKIQGELQTTLEDTSATPDKIKQLLVKLRQAREKAKQDLAKAQKDLRAVLTLRQEATLVLMGMLD
jgi:hypothetical protein